MINLRNRGDYPIVMTIKGTLTTTAGNISQYATSEPIPFTGVIKAVWGYEATAGHSAAGTPGDVIDLLYTPFTGSTTAPATLLSSGAMFNFSSSTISSAGYGQIALTQTATATAGGYGVGNIITSSTQFNPPAVARGGFFQVSCTTVASTPGKDFTCVVMLGRARAGQNIDPTQIGTYDAASDIF